MKRETQLQIARELLTHIDNKTTSEADAPYRNETATYWEPARAELEKEKLFRGRPAFVGLSCRLAKPGDFVAEVIGDMPVLMTRDRDGAFKAFANVCRHRGAPVAEGCGNKRAFVCPYHGWTYGVDGRLIGVTQEQSFCGVEKAEHGLKRLPAGEKHGLLFVQPKVVEEGESAELDVDALLGPELAQEFASYGFGGYSFFASEVVKPRLNWKFAVDTFMEAYHIPHLHARTVAPLIRGNTAQFRTFGEHSCLTAVRFGTDRWREQPQDQWDVLAQTVPIYRIFPGTVLVFQSDHVETWRCTPDRHTPSACEVEFALYTPTPPETDKAKSYWKKNYDLAIDTVLKEDFVLGERMQLGFESGAVKHMVYGRNEPSLIWFHRSVKRALGLSDASAA